MPRMEAVGVNGGLKADENNRSPTGIKVNGLTTFG